MEEAVQVNRKHEWVAVIHFTMTDEQARQLAAGEGVPYTRAMVRSMAGPVCFVCEQPFDESDPSCSGEATGTS